MVSLRTDIQMINGFRCWMHPSISWNVSVSHFEGGMIRQLTGGISIWQI